MRNLDAKQRIIEVTSAVTGHVQRAVGTEENGGNHLVSGGKRGLTWKWL